MLGSLASDASQPTVTERLSQSQHLVFKLHVVMPALKRNLSLRSDTAQNRTEAVGLMALVAVGAF